MTDDVIQLFNSWWEYADQNSPLKHKAAVCISTIDSAGFPDGRFVALKKVTDRGVVFCSSSDSVKGVSLNANPNIAMTIWWDHIERQIRVKGIAEMVSGSESDRYWTDRSRDAQLATWASVQSDPLEDVSILQENLTHIRRDFEGIPVPRPENWGGYLIIPISIEFLEFSDDRLHKRVLYSKIDSGWDKTMLQP